MPGGHPLPMFPLSVVLFPGAALPLHVFEPRYRRMVADCRAGDGRFGVVCITRGRETGGGDERASAGTLARIERIASLPDGRSLLVATGEHRIRVRGWLAEDPYPTAEVADEPDAAAPAGPALDRAAGAVGRARALISELGGRLDPPPPGPAPGGWALCQAAPLGLYDRQRLLDADDWDTRLGLLEQLCREVADDAVRLLAAPPDAGA